MALYKNVLETIGKTPLIELARWQKYKKISGQVLGKIEYFNPTGSVKDRAALIMIEKAEQEGILKKVSTIIEPTSGNTGISLASIAAVKGYEVILTMPETMSLERRQLLEAYGAKIVLTDGQKGMEGAIIKAKELALQIPNSYIPSQFTNLNNKLAHYLTTGPEIWQDTNQQIDVFVCGIGTGGTISGVGKYLKEKNCQIKIIGVEPMSSPFITSGKKGPHNLQGIGAGFIPDIFDQTICDKIVTIKEKEAYLASQELAQMEGLLVGISAGAALSAIVEIMKEQQYNNKNIVVLLADTGMRYLSTSLYHKNHE